MTLLNRRPASAPPALAGTHIFVESALPLKTREYLTFDPTLWNILAHTQNAWHPKLKKSSLVSKQLPCICKIFSGSQEASGTLP
jgi:hypothetical protein